MRKQKDKIRSEFENLIKTYETKIDLWKKVERVTKKDGSDFQSYGKNFKNVEAVKDNYLAGNLRIQVSDYIANSGFIEDYIETRQVAKYSKVIPSEDQIIKESFYEPYFYLTPDQMMEMIDIRISTYEEKIQSYKEQLEKLDDAYDAVMERVAELKNTIIEMTCMDGNRTSLYYEMIELVRQTF